MGTKFYVILEGLCAVLIEEQGKTKEVRMLGRGDSFGELGIIDDKPRAATVQCREPTHFAVLEKTDYARTLARAQEHIMNHKLDFLLSLPIFTKWTTWTMHKFSYLFAEKIYTWKQVICRLGDPISHVVIIKSGEAQMTKELTYPNIRDTHHSSQQRRVKKSYQVALLRTGEIIGLEPADIFRYSCICHSESLVAYLITKEDFNKSMNSEEALKSLKQLTAAKKELHEGKPDQERRQVHLSLRSSSPLDRSAQTSARPRRKPAFTLIPRLYPEQNAASTEPTPSVASPKPQLSWHTILTKKHSESKMQKSLSPSRPIVNIHTHKRRIKDLTELEKLLDISKASRSRSLNGSPRNTSQSNIVLPFVISRMQTKESHARSSSSLTPKSD